MHMLRELETMKILERKLTPREREVLALLADAKTNKEIASTLHMATETCKEHVQQLIKKLGAKNRTGAAVFYTKLRLLTKFSKVA